MSEGASSSSSGIGFFGLLAIVFITLKLMDFIHWSWWWVTLPLWGPITTLVVMLVIVLLVIASCGAFVLFVEWLKK